MAEAFAIQYSSATVRNDCPFRGCCILSLCCPLRTTVAGLLEPLKAMKTSKSLGPDSIHPAFLKEKAAVIVPTLNAPSTHYPTIGKLPATWNSAVVCCCSMRAPAMTLSYIAPSQTCITCQVIERVKALRLQSHLLPNQLLCSERCGFFHLSSCITDLLAREC